MARIARRGTRAQSFTSSSSSTVSPITMVDRPIGVNAAHEVRPMKAGKA